MIHWAWIILAFYSGGIMMLLLSALFQANGNPTPEGDAEQAAYLTTKKHNQETEEP